MTDAPTPEARPLIVAVWLEPAAQARFDAERAALFPPGRTAVGAHLTLFHALPGTQRAEVEADLTAAADRPGLPLAVTGLMPLGRGVAYAITSPELHQIHQDLQRRWATHLTPQDRQRRHPHITVQNKVTPAEARATLARLSERFVPHEIPALGLELHRYDGGPWTLLRRFPFRDLSGDGSGDGSGEVSG